ncbi:hypothetical protein AC578_6054 [Pseudocercospora eumusae]|uniref:Uncharacterized protein n=1 Tax=Pseudocercospora eumusae TaxID=321146 RepID=A0A139HVK8_9PEZI|nr:hypothetical protein AC578_6054 [Pseudocercospora eumusae]
MEPSLGTPPQGWMLELAGHLSITRDPRARNLIPPEREVTRLHATHKNAKGTEIHDAYTVATRALRSVRLVVQRETGARNWAAHFEAAGT